MYVSDLGYIALFLALIFSIYTMVVSVLGAVRGQPRLIESARRSVLVVTLCMMLASLALVTSFLTHDFGVEYVAEQSSRSMPWYFTAAAFYGGQDGSLLFWALMLSVFSAIFVLTSRRAPIALVPYVMATLMFIEGFFVLVLVQASDPFVRSTTVPADGIGLNPLLMDPGMLVHPPMLLTGYMSFAVPFAFAFAALITGRLNSEWLRSIRRWTLAAWSILTMGLLLGAWWSYHVLGWGGYWSWDPVENAALLPWLTATAFLHSTMVQERRGMLKVWNLFLIIASFALSVFGTFEVRSGVISSVHSFAYSDVGSYYFVFLVVIILGSLGLFFYRLPHLKSEQEFDSVVSREGVFLLNNLLLVGMTFATLWGTIFPLITALFTKQTLTVGPPFYDQVMAPLMIVLVVAMGIGPLLAWRRTSMTALWRNLCIPVVCAAVCAVVLPLAGVTNIPANVGFSVCTFAAGAILYELWRGVRVRHGHGENYVVALFHLFQSYRQRYGGYLVHLGLVLLIIGVIGSSYFQQQQDAVLKPGQSMTLNGYRLVFLGNIATTDTDKETVVTQLQLWHDGRMVQYIYPARVVYNNYPQQPTSNISITTINAIDVYVFLADVDGASQATIRVFLNPLVDFVWYGGLLMFLGGVFCWWPDRRRAAQAARVAAREVPSVVPPSSGQVADGGVVI